MLGDTMVRAAVDCAGASVVVAEDSVLGVAVGSASAFVVDVPWFIPESWWSMMQCFLLESWLTKLQCYMLEFGSRRSSTCYLLESR